MESQIIKYSQVNTKAAIHPNNRYGSSLPITFLVMGTVTNETKMDIMNIKPIIGLKVLPANILQAHENNNGGNQ